MSQKISIERKDGSKINYNGDGNVWLVNDKTGGPLLGKVINRICTIYQIHGLNENTKDRYLPVERLLLRYGRKLKIEKLRLQHTTYEDTRVGSLLKVRYGYVTRSRFDYLLHHRKVVNITPDRKAVLLKKSDFTFQKV